MSLLSKVFNKQKHQEEDLTKKRDAKCEPLAQQIVQIIATHNPAATKFKSFEESVKVYGPVAQEINRVLKEADVSISEANYTWSVVQTIFDQVKQLSMTAIQSSFELAEQKKFGVDNLKDLTLREIDNVLQSE